MARFTISLLSYCNGPGAEACIERILKHSGADYELWLHDNGGAAHGITAYFDGLAAKYPHIKVTHSEKNLGFIEPNNAAFDRCQSEFFVLINDDLLVGPNWLETLEAPFKQFPTAVLSGPEGGCTALLPNFHGTAGVFEYLEGSLLMVKVAAVRKVGPLFSPYLNFAYAEDSDLSLRMREAGLTLHKVKLPVVHKCAVTSSKVPEVRRYQEANHAACKKRWQHYLRFRKFDYVTIVKRADAFGDVLLTTPIIRQLKKQFPCSPIWVETNCTDVFAGNPHVARCERNIPPHREARYIDLNGSYENTVDTNILDAYSRMAGIELTDRQLDITTGLIPWKIEDAIAIHVGPSWKSKSWIPERWVELINELASNYNIVLVGHKDGVYPHTSGLDLRGKTTIPQLAAVLKKCRALVTIDSFPLHVAQAVGTPVVGLFGVTSGKCVSSDLANLFCVNGTGPSFGLRHRSPGTRVVDDAGRCMATITVQQVLEAVDQTLAIERINE